MTKIKKMLGVMIAALMCFALTPAMAFGEDEPASETGEGTITISNAIVDQTYSIYRILDLESYNADTNAYSYTVANGWDDFLTDGAGKDYVTINNGYVSWATPEGMTEDAAAAAFAKLALNYAKENGITAVKSEKAEDTTVSFTNLPLGYYLVDSSTGALCSLETTNPEAAITEKNDVPTVDKEVQEGTKWGNESDAAIGDVVNFRTTITGQPGAQNYVLHDTMTAGLTFNGISGITLNGTIVEPANYEVSSPGLKDECTFEIAFAQTWLDSIKAGDKIVVSYAATLNEDAVVGDEGNINRTKLDYGDSSETVWDSTKTFTWELPIFKYTGALNDDGTHGADTTALAGAVFELTKEGSTEVIATVTTDEDGNAVISGLDSGTYFLTETQAPNGYNKIAGAQTIVIANDGTITVNGSATSEVAVLNQSGSLLPSTGGIGTTIFYIVGGVLVIGAIVFFVRRRSKATK